MRSQGSKDTRIGTEYSEVRYLPTNWLSCVKSGDAYLASC